MELSRWPSSALRFSDGRSRRIIPNSHHTIKHIDTSKYASPKCSKIVPPCHISLPFPKSCSKLSTNGAPWLVKAIPVQPRAQVHQGEAKPVLDKTDAFWRFMTPFGVVTAAVQFPSILARRFVENPHVFQWSDWSILIKIFAVFVSLVCTNFYVGGINQIFDIEIDRINKPDLPLSSGDFPIESAWMTMLSCVAINLLIPGALNSIPFLAWNFCLLLVGTMYSVPPFRTKTSTIGAPITIALMQGFTHVFALFAGAGAALGFPFQLSLPMVYISIFTTIFSFSMGILKDISDVEGDNKNNIPTIATIIGVRKALLIGVGIHILNHLSMTLVAIIRSEVFKCSIMVPSHIFSVLFLLYQAWKMDQINYESTQSRKIYMGLWRVYFAQFLLLPFI